MKYIAPLFALCLATSAQAGPPQVAKVSATELSGNWRFDVTIAHDDEGWDHYADAWRVLDMNGKQLAIRELAHPHENEQPFTRSLSGIVIPAGTTQVQVQARTIPHGWGSAMKIVSLK